MHLSKEDNIFLAYLWRVKFRGVYPLLTDVEVNKFKNFSRNLLGLKAKEGCWVETDVLTIMRVHEKRSQLKVLFKQTWPAIAKLRGEEKANKIVSYIQTLRERIINMQIEQGGKAMDQNKNTDQVVTVTEQVAQKPARTNKNIAKNNPAIQENATINISKQSPSGDIASRIEAWSVANGKRYRMLKSQRERGLSREDAFVETHGK